MQCLFNKNYSRPTYLWYLIKNINIWQESNRNVYGWLEYKHLSTKCKTNNFCYCPWFDAPMLSIPYSIVQYKIFLKQDNFQTTLKRKRFLKPYKLVNTFFYKLGRSYYRFNIIYRAYLLFSVMVSQDISTNNPKLLSYKLNRKRDVRN